MTTSGYIHIFSHPSSITTPVNSTIILLHHKKYDVLYHKLVQYIFEYLSIYGTEKSEEISSYFPSTSEHNIKSICTDNNAIQQSP